jgi:hypothetical protein
MWLILTLGPTSGVSSHTDCKAIRRPLGAIIAVPVNTEVIFSSQGPVIISENNEKTATAFYDF